MAVLTGELFRNYFGGSWLGKITKNGEFQREIVFNWPNAFEMFSAIGTEEGLTTPPGIGFHDDTRKVSVAGWRQDIKRWCITWHNEFGGYGEAHWTTQETVNNITSIYGFCNECKQESDDLTNHIILCEMLDQDHFKYTINSFKKGLVEIKARRVRTAEELKNLMVDEKYKEELFAVNSKESFKKTI